MAFSTPTATTSARRGRGLGTPRALPGVRALRGMSRKLRGNFRANRSGSPYGPVHKICLRTFCARASGAVFAPTGRSTRRSGPSRPSGRCRRGRRPRPLRLEGPPLYACRYALCGLLVNPASLIVRGPQRQAARGRAGMSGRTTSGPPPGNVA